METADRPTRGSGAYYWRDPKTQTNYLLTSRGAPPQTVSVYRAGALDDLLLFGSTEARPLPVDVDSEAATAVIEELLRISGAAK